MSTAVRIGIVDSGVNVQHAHVGGIVEGIAVESDSYSSHFVDRVGRGTAVAALIHHLAPFADLAAFRVFDHSLATSIHRVIRAIA